MPRTLIWIFVCLVAGYPATADVDVSVPPGNPGRWLRGLPEPVLTGTGVVPAPRREVRKGSVTPMPVVVEQANISRFAGIATPDLPGHMPWTRPKLSKRPGVELTGSGGTIWRYPPAEPGGLYWVGLATLMRADLHPNQVSSHALIEYLTLLGHPSYVAGAHARSQASLRALAGRVMAPVGAMNRKPPVIEPGKSAYETMLLRLAAAELAGGHPYALQSEFAPKLRGLGAEGLSPVLALTRNKHEFLRRNATLLLGRYRSSGVAAARLRELVNDKDKVVRNRAIEGLAGQGDRLAVPLLIEKLKSGDKGLVFLAADALGRIGDVRAAEPLRSLLSRHGRNPNLLWALIPAVARTAARGDEKAIATLWSVFRGMVAEPRQFKVRQPTWAPDAVDEWTRAEVIAHMALGGLARLGDDKAGKLLARQVEQGGGRLAGANTHIAKLQRQLRKVYREMTDAALAMQSATGAEKQRLDKIRAKKLKEYQGLDGRIRKLGGSSRTVSREAGRALTNIAVPARYIVVEGLAVHGEHATLWKVVSDTTEYPDLRIRAWELLDITKLEKKPAETLEAVFARQEQRRPVPGRMVPALYPPAVRADALLRLERLEPERTVEIAHKIIERYLTTPAGALPSVSEWVVVPAVRVITRRDRVDTDGLRKIIDHAAKEAAYARQAEERAAAQRARMPYPPAAVIRYVVPPVMELLLLEAGRLKDRAGEPLLNDRLAEPKSAGRYQCALALGAVGGPGARRTLVGLLKDDDRWVRFGAYRALRVLAGDVDHTCDWLHGDAADREKAVAAWKAWLEKR